MGRFTEEELFQMVIDFIESSEPVSDSFSSHKSSHQSKSLALKEILWYLSDIESMIGQTKNLKNKWIVMKLMWMVMKLLFVKLHGFLVLLNFPKLMSSQKTEYVDVMMKDSNSIEVTRLIVDMDFKSQFEVARATPSYKKLNEILPDIFVGSEEKLDQVITLVCKAAKKSLKKMGFHVPPWRKKTYMHSKWLSTDCNKISISPTNVELGIFSKCTRSWKNGAVSLCSNGNKNKNGDFLTPPF